jgi:carbonic anhydrase
MADELLAGHGRFRWGYAASQRELLARLHRDGQHPSTLFIGCSDSRVVPELLTDAAPGDLFIVRNVANRVPARGDPDSSVGAAIEFAVGQLGVRDVVVCGHDTCGGVMAVVGDLAGIPADSDLVRWLADLRPAVETVRAMELDPAEELPRAIEACALDSLANLTTYEPVSEGLAAGSLRIHAWVYSLETTELRTYDEDDHAFKVVGASEHGADPSQ